VHASLSITVPEVDLLAERSSCSLLWHWQRTVFSVPPPWHHEAGDPDPSKDFELAEPLRSQGRSKGVYSLCWPPLPTPTPKSQEPKHAQYNTPASPLARWPHTGCLACGLLEEERSWAALQRGRMCPSPARASYSVPLQACDASLECGMCLCGYAGCAPGAKGPHKPSAGP